MEKEFLKYGKIKQIGDKENVGIFGTDDEDIVIQEKIDGANFRFMFKDDEQIIFGSRNRGLNDTDEEEGSWKRCIKYIREKITEYPKGTDITSFIFYGECCIRHSISYQWDKMPPYLGFDIYDTRDKVYLNHKLAKEIFKQLGLEFVPVIKVVKAKDIKEISDKDVPKSAYYEGPAEGIVFKNYAKQLMAKFVTDKFKEVNKDTFGTSKKWAKNDNEIIVAKYCTNPRIDKWIFKLIDDGHELQMKMMQHLPTAVYKDIMQEEGQEILFSKFAINFQDLKKQVTRRCLAVLKQVIGNNALSEKDEKKNKLEETL